MSAVTTYTELRTRYISGWTPPATDFPNEKFDKPVPASIWCRFTIVDGDEIQLDIGSTKKSFRKSGVLIIQLFSPTSEGVLNVLGKADTLAGVFRNWCGATVTCREASIRKRGNDGFGWYQVNVIVPFHTDVLH